MTIGAEFGMLKGQNLFHSFSTFNVGPNQTATFTGPSSVTNIIGRVTGGTASSVNGTIASKIPGANLVLVNPTGWVFGSGAALSVSGSVHISTADAVRFADGRSMPARAPDSSSLTFAPPTAFGFLGPNAGSIQVVGASLPTKGPPQAGKDLSLVGGPIRIEGASLSASAGKIRIVSAAGAGDVSIQSGARPMDPPTAYGSVKLSNATVSVSDASGGPARGGVRIKGGEVSIARGSQLLVNNAADADYPTISIRGDDVAITGTKMLAAAFGPGVGGSISIKGKGSVTVGPDDTGNTAIFAGVGAENSARGGNIDIASGTSIAIQPGTSQPGTAFETATLGAGMPGRISLRAPNITISGPNTGIASTATSTSMSNAGPISLSGNAITIANGAIIGAAPLGGIGNSGDVTITASQLNILDGAQVNSSVIGTGMGHGGNINVFGTGPGSRVTIDRSSTSGRTGLFSETKSGSNGSAGQVFVQADSVSLKGGEISSTSFGSGPAGSVEVQTHDLRIDGMGFPSGIGLFSNVQPNTVSPGVPTGQAGSVMVTADTVSLVNSAAISSGTWGNGNGGAISVTTNELSIDSHSGVLSRSGAENGAPWWTGNGGQIGILADRINVTGAGSISTSSLDAGKGGTIALSGRTDPLDLQVSGAGSSIQAKASGSQSNGAGSIDIFGRDLTLLNSGEISTAAAAGGGGQVTLGGLQLIRLDHGNITTSVSGGSGNAGDITMDSLRSIVLNQGLIRANADAGTGGHINIASPVFIASPDSVLDASAPHGINGTITIQAPQSNVAGTLAELPANLLPPPVLRQRGCGTGAASQGVSSFVLGSAGGLPRTGDGPQAAPYLDLPQAPMQAATRPDGLPILTAAQDDLGPVCGR